MEPQQEVYHFPGSKPSSSSDVILKLTYFVDAEKLVIQFHLHSHVLKQQSAHFKESIRSPEGLSSDNVAHNLQQADSLSVLTLKSMSTVNPVSYVTCFHAMYEAHEGESARSIAQTSFKCVADALGVLQVAAQLGFSVGVDASLTYIQAVPWTAEEEASISKYLNSLRPQVPMPDNLAARLFAEPHAEEGSVHSSRNLVKKALVKLWNDVLLSWRGLLKVAPANRTVEQTRIICNKMLWLFQNAVGLAVGDEFIQAAVQENCLTEFSKSCIAVAGLSNTNHVADVEAILFLCLRIVQALSKGEVACDGTLRVKAVSQCLEALETLFSSVPVQNHFLASTFYTRRQLQLAGNGLFSEGLQSYLNTYSVGDQDIKQHFRSGVELIFDSLPPKQQHQVLVQWLESTSRSLSPHTKGSFVDLQSIFNKCLRITNTDGR